MVLQKTAESMFSCVRLGLDKDV